MPILNLYKSEIQFQSAVDSAITEMESIFDVFLDFDHQLDEPIKIFKELLKEKPTKDNCYAIAHLLDYFLQFKQQFGGVKKLTTQFKWTIEPYFDKFGRYKQEEFLITIVTLEELMERYERILNSRIEKGVSYLKEHDTDFIL